jgi:hypothetical protein
MLVAWCIWGTLCFSLQKRGGEALFLNLNAVDSYRINFHVNNLNFKVLHKCSTTTRQDILDFMSQQGREMVVGCEDNHR